MNLTPRFRYLLQMFVSSRCHISISLTDWFDPEETYRVDPYKGLHCIDWTAQTTLSDSQSCFWLLRQKHALCLLQAVRCLSGNCVVGSCDCFFPPPPCTSQLLQRYHGCRGHRWLAVFLPQLYGDLALCAAPRTLQSGFRFILFDMSLVWWQGGVLLLLPCRREVRCSCDCLILTSMSACTPTYTIYSAVKSIFNPRACGARKQSTALCFSNTTPLGKSHSADGWVTVVKCEREQSGGGAFISSSPLEIARSSSGSFPSPDRSVAQLACLMVHLAQFVILFPISISPLAF